MFFIVYLCIMFLERSEVVRGAPILIFTSNLKYNKNM